MHEMSLAVDSLEQQLMLKQELLVSLHESQSPHPHEYVTPPESSNPKPSLTMIPPSP